MRNKLKWMSLIVAVCLIGILYLQVTGLYYTYRAAVNDLAEVADQSLTQVLKDYSQKTDRYNDHVLYSLMKNKYAHVAKFTSDTSDKVRFIYSNLSDPEYKADIFSRPNKLKKVVFYGNFELYLSESENLPIGLDSLYILRLFQKVEKKNLTGFDLTENFATNDAEKIYNEIDNKSIVKNFKDSLKIKGYDFSNTKIVLVKATLKGPHTRPENMFKTYKLVSYLIIPLKKYYSFGLERYNPKTETYVHFIIPTTFLIYNKLLKPFLVSILLFISTIIILIILFKIIKQQNKASALKDDFITNMTHEFKTPIATVAAAIEGMQRFNVLDDREKTNRYLETSKKELQRLNVLVNKVLDMASFEKGDITLTLSNVDLSDLLNDIIETEKLKNQKLIDFKVNIDKSLMEIYVDKVHFRNSLANLIDNAIKYSSDSVCIEINFLQNEHSIIGSVKDNGIGISKSEITKIFDKFHRVSKGNIHDVKGSGLGLSYTKYIIEKHGGTLSVNSELGKGSEFVITIPNSKSDKIS